MTRGDHINGATGRFESDKYPWCEPGFVPFKITDKMAQDLLWQYADRRRSIDPDFADDLQHCLRNEGFLPAVQRPRGWTSQRPCGAGYYLCARPGVVRLERVFVHDDVLCMHWDVGMEAGVRSLGELGIKLDGWWWRGPMPAPPVSGPASPTGGS